MLIIARVSSAFLAAGRKKKQKTKLGSSPKVESRQAEMVKVEKGGRSVPVLRDDCLETKQESADPANVKPIHLYFE